MKSYRVSILALCLLWLGIISACALSESQASTSTNSASVSRLIVISPVLVPDPRIRVLMQAEGILFSTDESGDYLVLTRIENRIQPVWVLSRTSEFLGLEIREIMSVVKTTNSFPAEITRKLLRRNAVIKIGAWHITKSTEGEALVFSVKVDASNLKASTLSTIINFVGLTAGGMKDELESEDSFWSPF